MRWRPFQNVKWFAIRLYLKRFLNKCWKLIQERIKNGG